MKTKIIFSDFDGTLTDHTEFSSTFIDIINYSFDKNIPFIIVTGRSLSWAHFFLTHFSKLNYVISEGGGVLSYRDERGNIVNEYQIDEAKLEKLKIFCINLKEKFPEISLSADSIGRVTDRAIELHDLEDIATMQRVTDLMDKNGITYSTSNVHLNFWLGDISKYKAVKNFISKFYSDISLDETIFFGDSLNDQSMFEKLKNTVGVSNIKSVIDFLYSHMFNIMGCLI